MAYVHTIYDRRENESDTDYRCRICDHLPEGAVYTAEELGTCKGSLLDRYVAALVSEGVLET